MNTAKLGTYVACGAMAVAAACGQARAQAQDVYAGETVRIIQPFGTGGAFDTVARLVTSHLNKYLPGEPDYVVESMPGAGGLVATNYFYNRVDPDGLTLGFIFASLLVDEAMGAPGVQFDSSQFEWVAAPSSATGICAFTSASGISDIEDWKNADPAPKLGAIGVGAELAYAMPRLLETQGDFPVHLIVGHEGGNPALALAAERGEIDGFCGSLESITINWGTALEDGSAKVIVQFTNEPDPAIPDVPLARDHVTSDEGRDLINIAVTGPLRVNRAFAFPPGTDEDIVATMRGAILEALEDPELREEAERLNVNINPVDGGEIETIVSEIHAVPSETVEKLKVILGLE